MNQSTIPFHVYSWNAYENVPISYDYSHSPPLHSFQEYYTTNAVYTPQRMYRMDNRSTSCIDYVRHSSVNSCFNSSRDLNQKQTYKERHLRGDEERYPLYY